MTEIDVYTGRVRRLCSDCSVEVEIQRPRRVLSKNSNRAWRTAYRKELQRQVMFDVLCPTCRQWWNETLRRVGDPNAVGEQPPA